MKKKARTIEITGAENMPRISRGKKHGNAIKKGMAAAKARKQKTPEEAIISGDSVWRAKSPAELGMVWDPETRTWHTPMQPRTEASKDDSNKVMLSLFPIRAYVETCKIFTYGAIMTPRPDGSKGYGVGNWHSGEGFDWQRLSDAAKGHHLAFELGEDLDRDSGYHHLAHEMCCNAMLLEHFLTGLGKDTRSAAQILGARYPIRSMSK